MGDANGGIAKAQLGNGGTKVMDALQHNSSGILYLAVSSDGTNVEYQNSVGGMTFASLE